MIPFFLYVIILITMANIVKKKTETKARKVKKSLVERYRGHKQDTGSVGVQIAILSERVNSLAKHLKKHQKDVDSRRGLLMMIEKRRRLLNYISRTGPQEYKKLITDLKLRK